MLLFLDVSGFAIYISENYKYYINVRFYIFWEW